ncbi:Sushi/SCR/CCP domain containing protein [Cryptosporidium hominis]|uniref:Sushi/SCR/CCP domain containing protein n=1 Tax=Cryptosporidium hominis TaxID=237895 RepID=A0ABX5BI32_CRYHO|nr:Sushi/SCR/CCP domain containing protein [Cryptosporidium hominis]|eukprot:PPS98050.1 Sushi/SCR/CCP domain containing protein [Cryptosporidium hominis]
MISKIKFCFIFICIFLVFCKLPYISRCEQLESEEIPTGEDEFGEVDTGIVSQKEFRKIMSSKPNDEQAKEQSSSKSGESKPEESNPDKTKPKEPKPDENKPEESKSGEAKPRESNSDEAKPEESKSDESKPEETKPDETKPEEAKSEEAKPEESKPDENKPKESKPDETKPEETKPEETKHDEENSGKGNSTEPKSLESVESSKDDLKKEDKSEDNSAKESTEENSAKSSDSEADANKDFSSSEVAQEEDLASESTDNLNDQTGNSDGAENTSEEKSSEENDEKSMKTDTNDQSNSDVKNDEVKNEDSKNDASLSDASKDTSKESNNSEIKANGDDKLEDNVEKTIQEMKDKLGVKPEDETIKRVDDQFIVIVKKLKQKSNEVPTDTKDVEVKSHDTTDKNPSGKNNEEKSLSSENQTEPTKEENKDEKKESETETENHEQKSNEELIEKLKSLSNNDKNEAADEKIKKINNLLEVSESDEKMEKLIQEKKDYDAKKEEKEKLPLQKKKKWYEKRDPITGELLFDAEALSRNITSTITAKRRKGVFSKCVEFHGQKENCESSKNCFYDSVYEMCLFDCTLLNKKDACEEYLECRFDFVVPRKACVNDCFQSRNFAKQELNGIMRGCMWCTQEVMCNTLSSLQRKKFPDASQREFDCNWQIQNGLENNDENVENSLCVDRNLGRSMTDKDLIAATYISTQTKLVHEAAERIKVQMVNSGETEESANLHVQNINLLKMNICYPPNIPYSQVKPEKKYYLNDEVIEVDCDDGYKITGANNQLRCENGIFSPKVYCIAMREIERQKSSISKHFNKILNLLINSITGGGEWINVGIEKMNESKDQERGEFPDALMDESEEKTNDENKNTKSEEEIDKASSNDTTTTTSTTTSTSTASISDKDTESTTKEELGKESDNKEEEKGIKVKDTDEEKKNNETDNEKDSLKLLEVSSESGATGKNILLDRVTGAPILVKND